MAKNYKATKGGVRKVPFATRQPNGRTSVRTVWQPKGKRGGR
jgi:hypothetical protein